jgi:hypothetical protein
MRILVISGVPWRDDNSMGNTCDNIFRQMGNAVFASLYCKPGIPNSKRVGTYFQITEKQLFFNLVKRKSSGQRELKDFSGTEKYIYNIGRMWGFNIFHLIRELLWKICNWRTIELSDFLIEFKPDVIFSFCRNSIYENDIIKYSKEITGAKLVLFFVDDVYSYSQRSPLYLAYKYFIRKKIRNMAKISDILYGITPKLCDEYREIFKKEIKLLYKVCEHINSVKSTTNIPLRITYTGNLFYGRWEVLALIAQAIKRINSKSIKALLHIYTTGMTTLQMKSALNIEGASQLYGAIPYEQAKKVLQESDIVLHVESFKAREIRRTRLSFSTKIVDCMQSGSCLLAIGPEETASIKLLKEHGIAQIVSSNSEEYIENVLRMLIENPKFIRHTAGVMQQFALAHHSPMALEQTLYKELNTLLIKGVEDK